MNPRNPKPRIADLESLDPEAALQRDDLHGASLLTRAAAWLAITVLAVVAIPAGWLARLRWRCVTQSQCCECQRVTRRAWLPLHHPRTSHTYCPVCARQLGIGV